MNTDWVLAIAFFRGKFEGRQKSRRLVDILTKINEADYLIAPIADNRMFQIIDTFISGEITDEQCKHCLAATNLGMQYVFLSEESIKHLQILEKCYVCSEEKEYYKKEQLDLQRLGSDKTKLARIQYKGKGLYLEEILR